MRDSILVGLALAIAAVMVAALWLGRGGHSTVPEVGFVTLQGEKLDFADLRGRVVLVNFWATDCATCLKEMPAMAATYRKYQAQGFEAVFIAMPYDRPDYVVSVARRHELPFKVVLDLQGTLNSGFGGVKLTPTTFILDKHGQIVERIVGEPDFPRLHALIERKLREPV